jgi:hypothetical protein
VRRAQARGLLVARPPFERVGRTGVWFAPVDTPDGTTADGAGVDPLPDGWVDGPPFVPASTLVWASGSRPAVTHLAPLHLHLLDPGAVDGPRSTVEPRLWLVGSASPVDASPQAAVTDLLDRLDLSR